MRLLAVGDLHWSSIKNLFPDAWLKHTVSMLDQVFDYAINKDIKTVIFTGDIFDTFAPSQDELKLFYKYFSKVKVNVVFYLGNHDIKDRQTNSLTLFSSMAKYAMPHCQFIIEPTIINIPDPVVILPWPHTKLPKKTKAKLGFAHVAVAGALADNGRVFKDGETLPQELFWIIGDLHRLQKTKGYFYPGALMQKSFQDDTIRYFIDVHVGKKVSITPVRLHSPYKLLTKELSEASDFEFLETPNTYWRILANHDIHVPTHEKILQRLPLSKKAKKNAVQVADELTSKEYRPSVTDYLRKAGYGRYDRKRLLNKLKTLR